MEKTTDPDVLSRPGEALASLGERLSPADTVAILKSLVCVGEAREKIIAVLEKKVREKFDGKAVKWAGGPPNNMDLKEVPRWPVAAAH